MSTLSGDQWVKEMDDVKAAINRRFPDFKCVRCGNEEIGLRIYSDDDFVIVQHSKRMNQIAELICSNCGFIERHFIDYLTKPDGGEDGRDS